MDEWLRALRKEKRRTQRETAEYVGITRAAYANIEKGVRRPSVKTAKRIAIYLGFDWTRFYDKDE